jgi:hypothetical protein
LCSHERTCRSSYGRAQGTLAVRVGTTRAGRVETPFAAVAWLLYACFVPLGFVGVSNIEVKESEPAEQATRPSSPETSKERASSGSGICNEPARVLILRKTAPACQTFAFRSAGNRFCTNRARDSIVTNRSIKLLRRWSPDRCWEVDRQEQLGRFNYAIFMA